jgi:hypothetical protein
MQTATRMELICQVKEKSGLGNNMYLAACLLGWLINGKEIYEGDILNSKEGSPLLVSWNKRFASFCLDKKGWLHSHWFGESTDPEDCEVIGNIYETPELINEK